jgi:hypothetical protein
MTSIEMDLGDQLDINVSVAHFLAAQFSRNMNTF